MKQSRTYLRNKIIHNFISEIHISILNIVCFPNNKKIN